MTIASYIDDAIINGKSITIKYVKYSGEISKRTISDLEYSEEFGDDYIEGFCHLRQERRTFKISRIREVDGIKDVPSVSVPRRTKTAFDPNTTAYITAPKPSSQSWDSTAPKSPSSNMYGYNTSTKPSNSHKSTYSSTHNTTKSEGCYIATMAYGDYDHPHVMILRRYRDEYLLTNWKGRLFVRFYYWISPKMVRILKGNDKVNSIIRKQLDSIVRRIKTRL